MHLRSSREVPGPGPRSARALRRRGANAVEFALTLPVLVVILSGVIDYSYYLHLQYNMINAVSQGARAGATTPLGEDPLTVARTVAEDVWTEAGLPGFPEMDASFHGTAPNIQVVVDGETEFPVLVGLIFTPDKVRHQTIMRFDDQS